MSIHPLSTAQIQIAENNFNQRIFLEGPVGSGKTTAAVERLNRMLHAGIPAEDILVLVPQRTMAFPYFQLLKSASLPAGGIVTIQTLGGIAQRTIQLFWPVIAQTAGFKSSDLPPKFLTLETAQYYMAEIVDPLIDQGFFDSIIIDRARLYSQILDNLNKAALVGFSHTEIGERLKSAWNGKPVQLNAYDNAQECASRFRTYCLEHNLLDFSLQFEVFHQYLWQSVVVKSFLTSQFHHLIYENVEEDVPVAHDILLEWLDLFDSALVIFDHTGGYRSFLGADPESGYRFKKASDLTFNFTDSYVAGKEIRTFQQTFSEVLKHNAPKEYAPAVIRGMEYTNDRFFPEMIKNTAGKIAALIHDEKVPPGEIAVLSPFLSDSLQFQFRTNLEKMGISLFSMRPSRSLLNDPVTRSLITLAKLAHPQWGYPVTRQEFRFLLVQVIEGLDHIRANLMAEKLLTISRGTSSLKPFSKINIVGFQDRITFNFGNKYDRLREWLEAYQSETTELDVFWSRLFGELLSQPGFVFNHDFQATASTAKIIESVQKFRKITAGDHFADNLGFGIKYINMVQTGVISAQYVSSWENIDQNSVYISPAHTFIMMNRPVQYQFWLDIGSFSWWQRLYQPLTHPYVLSRHWNPNTKWTQADEDQANENNLDRLINGLLSRCKDKVFLQSTGFNEQGQEEKGPLLHILQGILRRINNVPGEIND